MGLAAVEHEHRREFAVREILNGWKVRDLTKGRRGPKMLGAFAFPPPRNQAPFFLTIYGAPDGSKSQACWETVIHIKLTGHKC